MQILKEYLAPGVANLMELKKTNGEIFLNGIMMQSEVKNGNGRIYRSDELKNVVEDCQRKIKAGNYIMGELNHPDTLSIDLNNVSHAITEMYMDGNNAVGRMKLLNTPKGQLARAIMEGGVRLGVSSRGTGNVNESGEVSGFSFVTVDIVSTPSAPDAYPNLVYESLNSKKIMTLAEAVVVDKKAQAYLQKEVSALIDSIFKSAKK
jgi:hypothetical protein